MRFGSLDGLIEKSDHNFDLEFFPLFALLSRSKMRTRIVGNGTRVGHFA
jgi:hypothetical protein